MSDGTPAVKPFNIQEFARAASARRRALGGFILVATILAVVVSLVLPPWFRARATILPPTEGADSFSLMAGLIESSALSRFGLVSSSTPSDIFAEILRSRRLQEALIDSFHLEQVYRTKGRDRTVKELGRHVGIGVEPSGLVAVFVEDRDPQRAADMANYLVDELDRFNRESLNTRAKQTRGFLGERLADVRGRLHVAESLLTKYERENGVVVSEEAVRGMADVIAQKLSLQVQRSYVSSFTEKNSSELLAMDAELRAFDRELAKLPGLKHEGARLALDAEIQRKMFTLITAQYEEARIQEMRDTPTLTILDRAGPPEIKARPKRAIIVLVTAFVAALLATVWLAISLRRSAGV
jgi:uncharacterized protein involved in exopolysaccharide biosynthesis